MKKQILDALKAKFEGVSEAVLNRIADKLAKTVTKEEDVATAVEGVTFQSVIDSYGDSRATEATQSAIVNYEKKHGLKDGQKAEGGEPTKIDLKPGSNDDTPAWAQALINSNKELKEKFALMEGDKVANGRKQRLSEVVASAPAKYKERMEKDFARMNFKDDDEFSSWIGEVESDAKELASDANAQGAVFGRPKAGTNTPQTKGPSKDEVDKVMSNL